MTVGTAEALAAFALAAVPGVIVLEIVQLGRPHLREWGPARTFARYLLLSASAWAIAAVVADADSTLVRILDSTGGGASRLVQAFSELAGALVLSALGVGLMLALVLRLVDAVGYRFWSWAVESDRGWARRLANLATTTISATYAWDELLARLRRSDRAQLVHVRLRDGSSVYGVFAGRGRADYEADGRGILLDIEFVKRSDRLLEVAGSSGVYVPADAVSAVSFAAYRSTGAPGAGLHSRSDE